MAELGVSKAVAMEEDQPKSLSMASKKEDRSDDNDCSEAIYKPPKFGHRAADAME